MFNHAICNIRSLCSPTFFPALSHQSLILTIHFPWFLFSLVWLFISKTYVKCTTIAWHPNTYIVNQRARTGEREHSLVQVMGPCEVYKCCVACVCVCVCAMHVHEFRAYLFTFSSISSSTSTATSIFMFLFSYFFPLLLLSSFVVVLFSAVVKKQTQPRGVLIYIETNWK